ncbi:twin-arginine translocase TatA/TatE family subunit [Pseudomonas frederiksbergensis]|nr:twin-arginine translocase TatA/TatE family subunit [Pseudomonas frederiksbergensis]
MGIFDWKHWVVILIVVTLVFGTKKLKNLGSDLGETIKGFRKAMSEEESQTSVQPCESQQESQSSQRTIHVQATTNEELIQKNDVGRIFDICSMSLCRSY